MKCAAWACLLGLAVCAALPFAASAGELHAIVAGFNQYQHVQKLLGAEADAADIASVLHKRGVKDVVVMKDPQTTIADFKAAWAAMAARSARGDMLMFSFAGHGMRVPETRTPKRTPDGYDKGFLFPTYDQDQHPEELWRDEDLYDLFQETAAKGLNILFIVDACHAGTGIRGVAPSGSVRYQRFNLKGAPPPTAPSTAPPPRPEIASVAVITAQLQEKAIVEINVDGVSRGGLSYAVARGLEGAADPEGSGVITVDKLWSYVRPIVRERSGNNQAPGHYFRPDDGGMAILTAAPGEAKSVAGNPGLPELKNVAVFETGGPVGEPPAGAAFVTDKAKAELIYDAQVRQILNATGDTLASNVDLTGLKGAVEARQLLNALQGIADRDGGLTLSLSGGDGVYVKGTEVSVKVDKLPYKYLTLLDLTADGQLTLLYPLAGDPLESTSDHPLAIKVSKPFGADYVVAIRSEKPLSLLHDSFSKDQDGNFSMTAGAGYPALRLGLAATAVRVGIQGVYTCETLTDKGLCKTMGASSP